MRLDTWSSALRDLGVKLNTGDRHDVLDMQKMRVAIFTDRFANAIQHVAVSEYIFEYSNGMKVCT